jgi:hypothetical protein
MKMFCANFVTLCVSEIISKLNFENGKREWRSTKRKRKLKERQGGSIPSQIIKQNLSFLDIP